MSDCKYCGAPGDEKYGFCPQCWEKLCGELQELVVMVGEQHGTDCEHFQHAVESGVKYLVWKHEDKPRKKPEYDSEDDEWWKK